MEATLPGILDASVNYTTALKRLQAAEATLTGAQTELREAKAKLATKRVEKALAILAEKGQTWCTICNQITDQKKATLLLLEGVKVRSGGHEGGDWGCRKFKDYQRACPACLQKQMDEHGRVGKHDDSNGLTEHFHAFKVRVTDDHYVARKFGQEIEITDFSLSEGPPTSVVNQLVSEYTK